MKIIVTGAAGFIGSNLIKGLNQRGINKIIAVDNLAKAEKYRNLIDCEIEDYIDKADFLPRFVAKEFGNIQAVLHQGACSDTMATDGRYMMANNFTYSCELLKNCLAQKIQFLYASSAAIYGASSVFRETREYEAPLNIYGYSKFLFDQRVRQLLPSAESQVVGFRYFNVYGPRESHKGRMASVAFHNVKQFYSSGSVKLFGDYDGYAAGKQMRDFIAVDDVVKVNLFFLEHRAKSGIFNLGTGRAQPFNDIAKTVVNTLSSKVNSVEEAFSSSALPSFPLCLEQMVDLGLVQYQPFPDALKGSYQSFTEADITQLRRQGYSEDFLTVEQGVAQYCEWLKSQIKPQNNR